MPTEWTHKRPQEKGHVARPCFSDKSTILWINTETFALWNFHGKWFIKVLSCSRLQRLLHLRLWLYGSIPTLRLQQGFPMCHRLGLFIGYLHPHYPTNLQVTQPASWLSYYPAAVKVWSPPCYNFTLVPECQHSHRCWPLLAICLQQDGAAHRGSNCRWNNTWKGCPGFHTSGLFNEDTGNCIAPLLCTRCTRATWHVVTGCIRHHRLGSKSWQSRSRLWNVWEECSMAKPQVWSPPDDTGARTPAQSKQSCHSQEETKGSVATISLHARRPRTVTLRCISISQRNTWSQCPGPTLWGIYTIRPIMPLREKDGNHAT